MHAPSLVDFYDSDAGRRLLLRHAEMLALAAIVLCAAFGDGRVDLTVSHWFFDETRNSFPLTNQWLLKVVLHDAARVAGALAALTLLGVAVTAWSASGPKSLHERRQALLYAASACLAGAAAVGILKHFSAHACPWDLALFGGTAAYQPLFSGAAGPLLVRGCSPAAHPLVGYAWIGVGFAMAASGRRGAWLAWAVALALGTGFGIVQVVRGAHFLSHILWSAWTVWAVNVTLLALWTYSPRRRLSRARTPSAC